MRGKYFRSFMITGVIAAFFILVFDAVDTYRFQADKAPFGGLRLLLNLEWSWYDARLQFRSPGHSTDVMVAKIDDRSLARFGRWPWSRSIYPRILDSIYALGARTVSFDAVFSEPEVSTEAIIDYLKKPKTEAATVPLSEELGLSDSQITGISEGLEKIGELRFARGLSNHPRTTLGYIWLNQEDCKIYDPDSPSSKEIADERLSREQAQQRGFMHVDELSDHLTNITEQAILVPIETQVDVDFESYPCPISNRGSLSKAASYHGYFIAPSESDGVFRRIPLVAPLKLKAVPESARGFLPEEWNTHLVFFPSLALQSFVAWLNPAGDFLNPVKKPQVLTAINKFGKRVITGVRVFGPMGQVLEIPTQADGTVLINFLGSQEARKGGIMPSIAEFSLSEVPFAEDKVQVPPNEFGLAEYKQTYAIENELKNPLRNKAVVIGPTALGVYDLRPNSVQENAAGVFLHANLLARLIDFAQTGRNMISINFLPKIWVIAIFVVIAFLCTLLITPAPAAQGGLYALLAIWTLFVLDWALFRFTLQALPAFTMLFGLMGVTIGLLVYKYLTEERERAFVKSAFQKFVSPDLVRQIERDPAKLKLGGEKKTLSVLFSDIRGFTTISERMKAEDLARFMNEYLSPMTDIVLSNQGYLDKYMGDAIMAIYGAPVEYTNHAEKAVDSALAMMAKLDQLRVGWKAQGLPPMDIGIGINTGEMSAGNMGSSSIMAYTVMGDSVNLGSRLESINKKYHTHIIISEFTRADLGPEYIVREVDRVKVKGKNFPVKIFEVVGKGKVDPLKEQMIEQFEKALRLYYSQKFADAKKLFQELSSVDECSADYVGRCESMIEVPPAADWDGSSTMDSK